VSEEIRGSEMVTEPDCEGAAKLALAEGTSSRVYTRLVVDPGDEAASSVDIGVWASLADLPDEEIEDFIRKNADSFLAAEGSDGGSEAAVRKAVAIGRRNGLLVLSGTRQAGSPDSDHHADREGAAAVDLSNYPTPTPEMERTAAHIALAIGVDNWTPGQPLVREANGLRAQLLWRVEGHENHIHFGCRREP
jgi:hypothetical protein